MTTFTQKQLNIHNFKNASEVMEFDKEIQFYKELQDQKDQGYFDDAEEQQPLNLSLLQTIMGLGVREKVISSCPHKPCHEQIKTTRGPEQKFLNINELVEIQNFQDADVIYKELCYTEAGDGMLMDILEEDMWTNEIYLSKVYKWFIRNGWSFMEFTDLIHNVSYKMWVEEEEKCWARNMPDPPEAIYCVIWKRVFDWLMDEKNDYSKLKNKYEDPGEEEDEEEVDEEEEEIKIYFECVIGTPDE